MKPTRRNMLQSSLGLGALLPLSAGVPNFLLQTAEAQAVEGVSRGHEDHVLVMLQLTGGNDGLNTVVPYENDIYHSSRGTLRIGPNQVLKLNGEVGLHPNMRALHELYESKRVAVVQGVGYPNPNRSHFESMDIWHSAEVNLPAGRTSRTTGWLGRYLDAVVGKDAGMKAAPAIHLGGEKQPLALAGDSPRAISVKDLSAFKLNTKDKAQLARIEKQAALARPQSDSNGAGNDERDAAGLLQFLQKSTVGALASSRRLQTALGEYKTDVNYPNTPLGQKLKSIAQLIDAELKTRIYYVSLDGFDTHARQAGGHGVLMQALSDGLGGFMDDLKLHGHDKRVTVVVFSEFGRRVRENASAGTDHGTAGPVFVLSGAVNAGVLTPHPSLTDLDQGDLKYGVDFRQIYASLLTGCLGMKDVKGVLGRNDFEPLKLWA